MKTTTNGITRDPKFLRCLQVPFHTSLNCRESTVLKSFPLKTSFRHAQVPLTTGFTASLAGYFYSMNWEGIVEHIGEKINAHRVLVGKPEGKRPLGRPKCRRENNT